jgi:transforming growth factor-beta-induced protein
MRVKHWMAAALVVVTGAACAESPVAPLEVGSAVASRAPASQRQATSPTIVDVALAVNAESGEFSTLIAAVVAADLVGALSAVGQRTVFAPTDAAFAELGLDAGNIGTLPKAALTNILLYHVAPGRRLAADVVSSNRIRMSNGGFTTIRLQAGEALINDSRIVLTDVEAANGVIHVIDAVLLP